MRGSLSNLIAKTFKVIAKKKVFIPGKFANANEQACVKCSIRANEGFLYPLEKQFVFIHKPPILIRFSEIESVEFQRYGGGQGYTRNFDLCVTLNASSSGSGAAVAYTFSGIDRSDYAGLYNFLSSKKIPIKNLEGTSFMDEPKVQRAPVYNENEIFGGPDDPRDDEEEEEDEDYDDAKPEEGDGEGGDDDDDSDSDGLDDDEMGSEVDDDLDSDLEEARVTKNKKVNREDDEVEEDSPKKKKRSREDSNPKKGKKKKDPNAPKRAMSAYMFYMNSNRDKFKEENPELSFGELVGAIRVCLNPFAVNASTCVSNGFFRANSLELNGRSYQTKTRSRTKPWPLMTRSAMPKKWNHTNLLTRTRTEV